MSPRLLLLVGAVCSARCSAQELWERESIDLWELLTTYWPETSRAEGNRLWAEAEEEERILALQLSDDTFDLGNDTNDTNMTNLSSSTLEHIQSITQVIVGPVALFVGQDTEQLLHVLNGLMVGGISSLMFKLTHLDKIDPMSIVDIFGVLTAATGAIAATLQNPTMGSTIQGGVIFKQISGIAVKSFYLKTMQHFGGCAGISETMTSVYPHGVPENCTNKVDIPLYGEITGEEVGLWLMTGVEYGLVALGAMISPYLALLMCIANAASVGGHMFLDSFSHLSDWLMPKMGYSKKKTKAFGIWWRGTGAVYFPILAGIGIATQILMRLLRHKSAGHGPFKYIRFRATEARGGGDPWASISEMRLTFHGEAIDMDPSCEEPPKQGEKFWLFKFDKAVNVTTFCFMSGGKDSKPEDDPVSFVLEAVDDKEGMEEPPAEDSKDWLVIHESKQVSVPKARNARSDFFKTTEPKAPEPEPEGGAGVAEAAAAGVAGAAAGAAAAGAAASSASSAAEGAADAAKGALADAQGAAKDVEAQAKEAAAEAEAEAKGCMEKVKKLKTKALKMKYQLQNLKPKMEAKIQQFKTFMKTQQTRVVKVVKMGKEAMKGIMAPFTVLNHVVREATDQSGGKDPKSKTQIVMESLHALGWEEPMLRKVMHQTLTMLLKKVQVEKATIQKIVDSANSEELQALFVAASNKKFGEFVKDMEDVLRKLIEEEEEAMKDAIKPIQDTLDLALREFYMGEASVVVAKAFYTTVIDARMYLLTLQDITGPDGTVICKGRFADLDPEDTGKKDIKEMNEYLEKLASGKAFPGRTQHIAKMKKWLEEDEKVLQTHIKAQMGFVGTMMVKGQPIVKMYPKVMKQYAIFKSDPKKAAMSYVEPYKQMVMKKISSKISDVEKQAKDKAMATAQGLQDQAKDAAKGLQDSAMQKVADLEKKGTDAALAAAGKASSAAASAAGDLEAQAGAAKNLVPEAKHGAPPEESDAQYVALPDGPQDAPDATGDEYHDMLTAMVELKANYEMVIDELHKKLGLTIEEAKRLAGAMTDAERAHAAACGGVALADVMKLGARFGIHFNKNKAEETQKLVQAHKMKKELEASGPPYARKKAAKKAANMTPADISKRMSKPAAHREPDPPDMTQVIKGLQKEIKSTKAELQASEEKVHKLEVKLNRPEEPPEAVLKKLLEARANPAESLDQGAVKQLLAARANPQQLLAESATALAKSIPPEAAEKLGVADTDGPSVIVQKLLESAEGPKPQQMLDEVAKKMLEMDSVKSVLG